MRDAQRHQRCLPPAANTFPLVPAHLWVAGLLPRTDFFQALGQLVVSGDQQKSSVLALFWQQILASRQLSQKQAHRRQGGVERPLGAYVPFGQVPLLVPP